MGRLPTKTDFPSNVTLSITPRKCQVIMNRLARFGRQKQKPMTAIGGSSIKRENIA
jgi:hypothetical protein